MQFQYVLARVRSGRFKKDRDPVVEGAAVPTMKGCRRRFTGPQLAAGQLFAYT
jgi:hypothetical protein